MELIRTLSSAAYFIKSYNTYTIVDIKAFYTDIGEKIIHVEREREKERERGRERESL